MHVVAGSRRADASAGLDLVLGVAQPGFELEPVDACEIIGQVAKDGAAVLGDEVIGRATVFEAGYLREADEVALWPRRVGADVEAADQPVEFVIEKLAAELELVAVLVDGIVERGDDQVDRCACGKGAGAIGGDP